MSGRLWWALAAAAVAAAGTGAAVRLDADLAGAVRDVAARLQPIRGAVPPAPPLAVRAGAEDRREAALARRDAALAPSRLAARGRAWVDIGLGTADDPATLYRLLATDLPAWTLSADGKQLLVAEDRLTEADYGGEGGDRASADLLFATGVRPDEPAVAHVLTHTLQDVRGVSPGLRETTDATLATSAWREGEANLVAMILLYRGLGLESEVTAGRATPDAYREGDLVVHAPAGSSRALTRLVDFVYAEGFLGAAARVRGGGWQELERAMSRRPETRGVLHPDRAVSKGESVAPPSLALPEGYRLADRDALGEFPTGVLVAEGAGKENLGWIAADGWEGDSLFRWEAEGNPDGVTLWTTRWTDDEQARDFRYAMERVLAARFPGNPAFPDEEAERVVRSGGSVVRLLRRGATVDFRVAPPAIDAALGSLEPAAAKTQ